MKKFIFLILLFTFSACGQKYFKELPVPETYEAMFTALKLKADIPYVYEEVINNQPTGKKGTVVFSLKDTTMTETFNLSTTKEKFRLENFGPYSCNFVNPGVDLHPVNTSVFINRARQTISYVNGRTFISFSYIDRGSYYFNQFILTP